MDNNDKPKDAPQKRNKFEQVEYLTGLVAIVSYLDDTGEEHHPERVLLAKEWDKSFTELCETIKKENEQNRSNK